jgi:SPX domain protein involved in polyphosphate accumulation
MVKVQRLFAKTNLKIQVFETGKSGFVERFPELSVFFKACRALYDEMICIFPYFCPCEIIVREIREISF